MGNLITKSIQSRGQNPFAGRVRRNEQGEAVVNLREVLSSVGGNVNAMERGPVGDLFAAVGDVAKVDDLRNYSRSSAGVEGGDRGNAVENVFSPFAQGSVSRQAIDAALEAYDIEARGRADAERIAQEGRNKAAISNMGAGIASAQRQALSRAETNAYDNQDPQQGGNPDVVQGSNVTEEGGEEGGNDVARRRRQSFGGAGLAMRI